MSDLSLFFVFFFFKQKTAYEMRISDWSSDVCSSDLGGAQVVAFSQFACSSTRAVADVILPIGALPEIDATLTNLDGRDQVAVAGGKLPGEARAGWRVLRALGEGLGIDG